MKVTLIKPAVKTPGRYLIFIDNEFSFSLSQAALLDSQLFGGQELTQSAVDEFKNLSNDDKLFNRALALVAARPKTRWEVSMYLSRKGASEAVNETILNKLSYIDLINDQKYAINFVANRVEYRPTSRRKLVAELKKKRVNERYIEQAIAQAQKSDLSALRSVVAIKLKQTKYNDRLKLMQYLARQGFNYQDIKSVLNASDIEASEY